jgi:YgiT-type zinc finger domain-containing protein
MKKEKCYICEKGSMIKKKVDFSMYGINLGKFEAQVCNRCGEEFFDEKTSDLIDEAAKEKGLWGLDARTKVNKVGTSIAVTINKKIANFMNLKQGKGIFVHPESKNKLVIEVA